MPTRLIIVPLLATLALVLPAAAQASSIVYINGGNVWLANPDGSGQYQVTLDGTAAAPYSRPSQADDGTIVAVRGGSGEPAKLYRMSQNGTLLNTPFATASPLGNVIDAEISPDGSKVVYSFVTIAAGYTRAAAAYTYADHLGEPPGADLQQGNDSHWLSWAGNDRTLSTNDSDSVVYDDVSGGDGYSSASWFGQCSAGLWDCSQDTGPGIHDLAVARDGRTAAWIWQLDAGPYLQLATTAGDVNTGAPPQAPTTPACHIGPGPKESNGAHAWDRPTFAPDGSSVAWAEGDGIHVTSASLQDCDAVAAGDHLAIAGGSQPLWGPAAVSPAPRGGGHTGGGGGTPPPTGGATSPPPPHSSTKPDPAKLGSLRGQHLRRIARKRAMVVKCKLPHAGSCSIRATISAKSARKLHLKPKHKAKTYTLGSGRRTFKHAGSGRVRVKLSRNTARRLRHAHKLRITFTATATYADGHRKTIKHATFKR